MDDRILNHGRVNKMLQMFQESTSRSSDKLLNQPSSLASPMSNDRIISTTGANREESVDDLEAEQNEISSDEDSMKNVG